MDQLNFTLLHINEPIDFDYLIPPAEWNIINATGHNKLLTYNSGNSYSTIEYTIVIERKHQKILGSVLFPVLMISLIMLTIMIIPLSLSEKIAHILTLLLMITVYQLILLENLPASEEISVAGIIVQGVFKMAAFLTFISLFVQICN